MERAVEAAVAAGLRGQSAKEVGAYVLDHHVTSVEIRRIHDTAEKRG